ncbi:hypothetical protein [Streptomyces sp. SID486]|uniref:hypothetical protein n=1 Tax=Streptomyces sp. SID486 TaxID=2690264 RepID=UPI001F36FFF5|nr:hypothetical protein [Streptomyces sp. SID486]
MFSSRAYASRSGPRGSVVFLTDSQPDTVARRTFSAVATSSSVRPWAWRSRLRSSAGGSGARDATSASTASNNSDIEHLLTDTLL